jgi:hypothetical protein
VRAFGALVDNYIASYQDRPPEGRKEDNAIRLVVASLAYQVLDGFRRRVLGGHGTGACYLRSDPDQALQTGGEGAGAQDAGGEKLTAVVGVIPGSF